MPVRLVAIGAAIVWGFVFFGLIDLLVVIIQDDRFYDFYLLETGWGLLYTLLVGVALIVFAFRPRSGVLLQQLLVVAAAVLVCAAVTPAVAQTVPALFLAGTAVALAVWSGLGLALVRGLSLRNVDRGMAALALVAAVAAVHYASEMIEASRAGAADDDTWGLMHLPMQAAFGLSVAGVATLSVLACAAASPGWETSALSAAVAAAWLGAVSVAYPGHLGSLGRTGGFAAVVWGGALAAGALRAAGAGRRSGRSRGSAAPAGPR
ncbi:MAG: hypothetical protein ACXV4A_00600 [Actinomycetes bacterium]